MVLRKSMGEYRPYESFGRDFDKEFIEHARFQCRKCGKECRLDPGRLLADRKKMYAVGKCSECRSEQKFDVTNDWREE